MSERIRVRVERIAAIAEGIREITLAPIGSDTVPNWRAGAHIQLFAKTMAGHDAQRRYSLVKNSGNTTRYVIAVNKPHEFGVAAYLHTEIVNGCELEISSPINDFAAHSGSGTAILIAGGIGITPILSLASEYQAAGRNFEIHYSARSTAAMAYQAEVKAFGNHRAHLYFSNSDQKLQIKILSEAWRSSHHVFVCGPKSLIEVVKNTADSVGIASSQIHFESFGERSSAANHSFRVDLRRSDRTITVHAAQSILEAVHSSGIYAQSDCTRGECGVCTVHVVDGEVDHRDICLSESDRHTARLMTPCVSRAKSERLVIDL